MAGPSIKRLVAAAATVSRTHTSRHQNASARPSQRAPACSAAAGQLLDLGHARVLQMADHPRHQVLHPVRCPLHASIGAVVWIRTIPWDESEGVLRAAYDWQASRLGEPAEFTMLGSLYPEVVEERLRLYRVVEGCPSDLTAEERVLAAFITSLLNGTAHCASGLHHRLLALGWTPDQVGAIEAGPSEVRTGSPRLDAVAAHAVKLTTDPAAVTRRRPRRAALSGPG